MAIHDSYYTNTFRATTAFYGGNQGLEQARFVADAVGMTPQQDVLDVGCGFGRHSLELAAMGYRITGLDQSADYLDEARQAAKDRNLQVRFEQQDMRQMAFDCAFDVVLSLSTSLAFYDDAANTDIFRRVCKALRPGGMFFFDQSNIFYWMKVGIPDGYRFDACTCVLSARRLKDTADGPIESGWDLRLYHLPELKAMLGGMGFTLVKSFGDYDSSEFAAGSKRLITMWRKL